MDEQNNQTSNRQLPPLISWSAPEYQRHEKGRTWFMIAGVFVLMLCVYFILTDSASAAIAFILLAAVYFLVHRSEVKELNIEINELGIRVGNKQYLYAQLQNFWIIYNPPNFTTLNFQSNTKIAKQIVIQLGTQDPSPIRRYLRQQLPEVEGRSESFWDILLRILKI